MRVCVMDGQGGGIGSAIVKKLKDAFGESIEVLALGTNAIATAQMLKAGANQGASGENAIIRTVTQVDIIIGPIAIVLSHSMMGEVTARMAEAVAMSPVKKLLIPLSRENVEIVGLPKMPLPPLLEVLVDTHFKELLAAGCKQHRI